MKYIVVLTTTSTKKEGEKISALLLKNRLASCVQIIGPIKSKYWWKGKIEKASEWLCIIKSKLELYERLEKIIEENHSYELPEIIAIPIEKGSKKYLRWIDEELKIR
ncbi:MAG: divalent-cation tolerance protein CutA [Candidatus Thermoplasmatota archaeon]